jgi:hypothetical protein
MPPLVPRSVTGAIGLRKHSGPTWQFSVPIGFSVRFKSGGAQDPRSDRRLVWYFARIVPKQFHQPLTHAFTRCTIEPNGTVRLAQVRLKVWDFQSVHQVARELLLQAWPEVHITLMVPVHTRERSVSLTRSDMKWEVWPQIFTRVPTARAASAPPSDEAPRARSRRTAGFQTVMPVPDSGPLPVTV